jgi:non-ribosomal peptide synthetase component F
VNTNINTNTNADYPEEKTIHQLFEEQAEKTPHNTAVIYKNHRLTYQQLNEKANSLAHLLRGKGVDANTIVGINVERSLEMIVGIFGILKAGGAYLPVSPANPGKRILHLLKESTTKIVLTQGKFFHKLHAAGLSSEIINIDLDNDNGNEKIYQEPTTNLSRINKSRDLVYVIYTSGSTGTPKGVAIEHRSLVNRLYWMQRKYPLTPNDTILQKTPFFFDVSVWEMFWWSLVGACVCFLMPGHEKFPQAIVETVENNGVTVMHFVPSMMSVFLEYLRHSEEEVKRLAALTDICQRRKINTLSCSGV